MTIREDRYGLTVQASRPFSSQSIAFSTVNALSAAFSINLDRPIISTKGDTNFIPSPNQTRHVRLVATTACWVAFGGGVNSITPVALRRDPGSMFIPAGLPEYFWVQTGEQIGVVQDAAAGFLYITELTN